LAWAAPKSGYAGRLSLPLLSGIYSAAFFVGALAVALPCELKIWNYELFVLSLPPTLLFYKAGSRRLKKRYTMRRR